MSIKIPVNAELNQQDLQAQVQQMEAALNDLGRVARDAGKVKFSPITGTTLEDLKRIRAEFEAIQRMAPGLKKALEAGGQGGQKFEQVDWDKVWTDKNQRASHAAAMLNRMKPGSVVILPPAKPGQKAPGGGSQPSPSSSTPSSTPDAPSAPGASGSGGGGDGGGEDEPETRPRPRRRFPWRRRNRRRRPAEGGGEGGGGEGGDDGDDNGRADGEDDDDGATPGMRRRRLWRRVGASAFAGVAGGAASQLGGMTGSIASGAVSGAMMGGGLGAVVGGLAGALTGILGAMTGARDVAISLDTLKRTLGDIDVSFEGLQATTRNLSDEFGLTDAESTRLTTQYARRANSDKDMEGLRDEVGVGVGFSRSFGLDPAAGVDFFGQMRGLGITQNADDAKRLALLIGESVAKAGDLPRLGDVLAGLTRYMENASRISLTAPNSAAWLSRFAGLEKSGLAGMDPSTAASIIGNIDNSIRAGGVTEAGRNFMNGVLQRDQNLNTIQAAIQLEGGAFGTGRSTFGGGSAMERFYQRFGGGSPSSSWGNDETNISVLQRNLISQYQGKPPELMLDAFKNTFGTSYGQAAAWMSSDPVQNDNMLKRMQRLGINWKDVNATGVAKISQIEANDSMSEADKDAAIREAATKNQEDTIGSEARANAAKTANAVERLATEGLPMLNAIQAGVLKLAGVDTPGQLIKQIEHAKRKEGIEQDLGAKKDAALKERNEKISFLHRGAPMLQTPEEAAIDKKYWDAKAEYDKALEDEDARYKEDLKKPDQATPGATAGGKVAPGTQADTKPTSGAKADATPSPGIAAGNRPPRVDERTQRHQAAMATIESKEGAALAEARKLRDASTPEGLRGQTAKLSDDQIFDQDRLDAAQEEYDSAVSAEKDRYAKEKPPERTPATKLKPGKVTPELLERAAESDRKHGFPVGTTAGLMMQESRFNPDAVSSVGARGMHQIMPENVAWLSKRAGRQLDPTNTEDSFLMYDMLMQERKNYKGYRNLSGDEKVEKMLRSYHGGYKEQNWGEVNADYVPAIERRKREMESAGQTVQQMTHNVAVDVTMRDSNGNRNNDATVVTTVGKPTASGTNTWK